MFVEKHTDVLVSIVTPTFNAIDYLEGCIQSVLMQTYSRIEHLFVDGGSTDGTVELLSKYRERYPDRIVFVSEPDRGPGDAWNKGLKMASGNIFGAIGYDDRYLPDAVETVVRFFCEHPEAHFVHGNCDFVDAQQEIAYHHEVEEFDYREFANTARHISTTSAFYRREVMDSIGWLDASGDDFDVMLRIARQFRIHGIEKVLSRSMIHESAFNPQTFDARKRVYRNTYLVSKKYGGSSFSPLAMRYYASLVIDLLHLQSCFPFMLRAFRRCSRYPYSQRVDTSKS